MHKYLHWNGVSGIFCDIYPPTNVCVKDIVSRASMVLQNYQKFIEMTSNMIYIVALGVGFKCPRKINLNTLMNDSLECIEIIVKILTWAAVISSPSIVEFYSAEHPFPFQQMLCPPSYPALTVLGSYLSQIFGFEVMWGNHVFPKKSQKLKGNFRN